MHCKLLYKHTPDNNMFFANGTTELSGVWFNNLHVFKNHLDEMEIVISDIIRYEGYGDIEHLNMVTISGEDNESWSFNSDAIDYYYTGSYMTFRFKLPSPVTVKFATLDREIISENNTSFTLMRGETYLTELTFDANESHRDLWNSLSDRDFDIHLESFNVDSPNAFHSFHCSMQATTVNYALSEEGSQVELICQSYSLQYINQQKVNYCAEGF